MIKNHLKLKMFYFYFWAPRHLHKKSPSDLDKKGKLFNTMFSILIESKLFVSDANMQPFGLGN